MRSQLVIQTIKDIKMKAIDKQMYEMAMLMRNIERELSSNYLFDDEVDVVHFTELLQVCLDKLPEDQVLLLKPIIRELKLSQILKK
jgi:hypothetical protein